MNEKQKIHISNEDVNAMSRECIRRCVPLNEDMTRAQVEAQIDDFIKSKDFEKKVHNIAVDVIGEFLENMWLKKSFWKTMIKKK